MNTSARQQTGGLSLLNDRKNNLQLNLHYCNYIGLLHATILTGDLYDVHVSPTWQSLYCRFTAIHKVT